MKLMNHSSLRRADERVIRSLELLGARVSKPLKDTALNRKRSQKSKRPAQADGEEEGNDFSRFVTALKTMLENHIKGTLDQETFPYLKPELIPTANEFAAGSQASLRSAKPTWAKSRLSAVEPRQRVIVFVAGGATYSESRACYEVSKASVRDVFLGSTHIFTPNLFLTQLAGLKEPRDRLLLPADMPQKEVPAHLLQPDPEPKPVAAAPQQRPSPKPQAQTQAKPPVKEMSGLKVHHQPNRPYYEEDKKKKKKKFGGLF